MVLARRSSYSNRRVRKAARSYVRANALVLVMLLAGTVVACVIFSWLLDGFVAGLFTGFFVSSIAAMVALSFLLVAGMTFQISGAMGETNSADMLRSALRRGHILGWIDNIEVQSGDIDHLVFTRAGILAIDSKWHSHGLSINRMESDASSALASASRARSVLRAVQVRRPIVLPLVVVWGGDQQEAHGGKQALHN
jgi:Nuclease-related domain